MLGDFNDILLPSKVLGGSFYPSRATAFANMMDRCRLMDLGLIGGSFTWVRCSNGNGHVCKRLD